MYVQRKKYSNNLLKMLVYCITKGHTFKMMLKSQEIYVKRNL